MRRVVEPEGTTWPSTEGKTTRPRSPTGRAGRKERLMPRDGGRFRRPPVHRGVVAGLLLVAALFLCSPAAVAEGAETTAAPSAGPLVTPPTGVRVADTPDDRGGSVNVTWELSSD